MGREDSELLVRETTPASSDRILDNAQRRLLGSIKHEESSQKVARNAERVRSAQLGFVVAKQRIMTPVTNDDDEQRARIRNNLAEAKARWEAITTNEIIALYRQQLKP